MKQQRKRSEIIQDFLDLIKDCESKYPFAVDNIKKSEQATQDLLHTIELDADYKERCRAATTLSNVRKDRRYYKDLKEETEILVNFKSQNTKAINTLKQCLGEMRRVEKYHEGRHYYPRIIKEE